METCLPYKIYRSAYKRFCLSFFLVYSSMKIQQFFFSPRSLSLLLLLTIDSHSKILFLFFSLLQNVCRIRHYTTTTTRHLFPKHHRPTFCNNNIYFKPISDPLGLSSLSWTQIRLHILIVNLIKLPHS